MRSLIKRILSRLMLALVMMGAHGGMVRSESKLDIGAEYRFRSLSYSNPTYSSELPLGSGNTLSENYYSQRGRFYIKGKLTPGIEIGSVFQAIVDAGSTGPFINRYPKEDFTPFIEAFYISDT